MTDAQVEQPRYIRTVLLPDGRKLSEHSFQIRRRHLKAPGAVESIAERLAEFDDVETLQVKEGYEPLARYLLLATDKKRLERRHALMQEFLDLTEKRKQHQERLAVRVAERAATKAWKESPAGRRMQLLEAEVGLLDARVKLFSVEAKVLAFLAKAAARAEQVRGRLRAIRLAQRARQNELAKLPVWRRRALGNQGPTRR